MKDNYQKIEATFGQITIFKKNDDKSSKSKPRRNFRGTQNNTEEKETFSTTTNNSQSNEQEDLNFFDKQLVGDYFDNKSEHSKLQKQESIQKEVKSSKIEDLDFIDEFYFKPQRSTNGDSNESTKNITKKDIDANDPSLNYIDQISLNNLIKNQDDNMIGSVEVMRENQKSKDAKESDGTIPIIQSENLSEKNERATKKNFNSKALFNKNKNKELEPSEHKKIFDEIPKWDYMTNDEAVKILKSHVCYYNEEQGLFALDKPYGLPSIGGPKVNLSVAKLIPLLEEKLNLNQKLLMCHRLDEFTTGVMLFATNAETASKIREMFDKRKLLKQYLAITKNVPSSDDGVIDIPLIRREVNKIVKTYLSPNYDENTSLIMDKPKKENYNRKNAITKFRVLDSNNNAALVECQPLTGFQHQIRAHLAFGLGCPILGDHKYSHHIKNAPQKLPDEMLKCLKIRQSKVRYVPMHLHAKQIILPEFWKNSNVFISAKLPIHFLNNLKRLKLKF